MVAISNFHLGPLTRKAARPQWVRDHPRAPWAAVAAVCLGAFMGQRDASIVTLTYPRLQSEFATRLGSVAWVSLSYLVVLAVLLVPWVGGRTREDESCCTCMDPGCSPRLSGVCSGADPGLARGRARDPSRWGRALTGQQRDPGRAQCPPIPSTDRARISGSRTGTWPGAGTHLGWSAGGCLRLAVGVLGERPGWPRRDLGRACSSAAQQRPYPATGQRRGRFGPAGGRGHIDSAGPQWPVRYAPAVNLGGRAMCRGDRGCGGVLARRGTSGDALGRRPLAATRQARCLFGGGAAGLFAAFRASGPLSEHLRASDRQRVAVGSAGVLAAVLANIALWRSPCLVAVLLLLMGAFLGLVIPANNAAVMAAVPAIASAVTGGIVNVARALGTALGVSITTMGLRVAYLHQWVGPQVVLSA